MGMRSVLTIKSDLNNLLKLENYLNKLKAELAINDEKFPDILISLTEAVNNAIIHGNKVDKKKDVNIHTVVRESKLSFTITDEGSGFCPDSLPDPCQPENLECCGGRGVMIMKALSDGISFEDNGRTVNLVFNNCK